MPEGALVADRAVFTSFGTSHQVALLVTVVGAVVLVTVGRRTARRDPADRLGRTLALVLLATTVPLQVLYLTPGSWSLSTSLPLQLSDLAAFVSVVALWTHARWAVALTYYWGLVLTPQAIVTPDLVADFPDPVFVLFWAMHVGTVWAALHLVAGRGLGPDWRRYRTTLLVTASWAVCVFCFNLAAGTNYGYLNRKPASGSVLDLLGPWPWYVVAEVAVLAGLWALMTWPWVRRRERRA